jgi:IS1 family transposase
MPAPVIHDEHVRNVNAQRIQCDEIWQYCYAKAKNVPQSKQGEFGYGDVWTWTAIDPDTKLVVSWIVGERRPWFAYELLGDLYKRLSTRVQMTDGLNWYRHAVEHIFGIDIDFAQLQKHYADTGGAGRYSPARFISSTKEVIRGNPDPGHICTSHVERQNLTMRMSMRRFTRLTNGFSKKAAMHAHAVALHFAYYNFCKVHQTLRVTPAMEAGLSDHVWSVEELVELLA